jgi:hypothetical protein
VIDTLKLYMSLNEKDITEVKKVFTNISMDILDEWLNSTHREKEDNKENKSEKETK